MQTIFAIGMPGGMELFVIVFIVLLLFGAKKIPDLARGMGKGIREFKDATKEIKKEVDEAGKEIDKQAN
ncbi:Sec-independent protein translocase subunit TatA/TatB [Roseivirga echinicomitans]